MRTFFTLLLTLLILVPATAQEKRKSRKRNKLDRSLYAGTSKAGQKGRVVYGTVFKGDTIPAMMLPDAYVIGDRHFKNDADRKAYERLKRKVKKVYPYAKLAGERLEFYSDELAKVETKRERKKFYKKVERELKEKYEGDLRRMSISEGRILVKLIDRQTGNSSFLLIKELRNGSQAVFWQSVAKIFGNDLKARYDPKGKDRDIESIVQLIERGVI